MVLQPLYRHSFHMEFTVVRNGFTKNLHSFLQCGLSILLITLATYLSAENISQENHPKQAEQPTNPNETVNPSSLNELDAQPQDSPAQTPTPFFRFLDSHQQAVSSYLRRFVIGIDNFFVDSQTIDETSGSYLRLTTEFLWPEGAGAEFDGGISLKVRLPKTQKKLKLTFESDVDEKRNALDQETSESATIEDENRDNIYYTGLEGELDPINKWKIRPSIGIKLRSPLDYYVRLRANREVVFNKWLFHFNDTLFWFESSGFGNDTSMRWDRRFHDDLLIRSNSFARYTWSDDQFEFSQTFSLIQTLSKKRAITYKAGVFGLSQPSVHATDYLLSAQYRNNLHSDYLFLDIQPQIIFRRENDFKGIAELIIRLEIFYRD